MTDSWIDNPPVRAGIRRMLESRAEVITRGERVIGWKLGFGAPAWLEKFGIPGPLVGFLPESRLHQTGTQVSVRGWTSAVAEAEIAVHFDSDVDDPNRVASSICAIAPAIELADIDPPPDDLAEVVAGNIYHRALILGEADPGRAGGDIDDLVATIMRNGEEVATIRDLEELTGELIPILAHTARLLAAFGESIRSGDVVIAGSVVPPLRIAPDEEIGFRLAPFPAISVVV